MELTKRVAIDPQGLESAMRVSECMTRDVRVAAPTQSMSEAARLMAELDIGALPVGENDRLVGMVTDRDIAVRGVANGRGPDTPIREVMSPDICYCYDDETVDDVIRNMGDIQVRRLPVLNRSKRLVGIISLGDVAQETDNDEESASALRQISTPGGDHSQSRPS
jgi:CBS domain-containing protein